MKAFSDRISYNRYLAINAMRNNELICNQYPTHVLLDIGNVCNQYCKFCNPMLAPQTPLLLSPEDFEGFDWLKFVESITFSGNHGDVFANKKFPAIFNKIKKIAPHASYGVYTNGLGLSGENLEICINSFKTIHVSVNAITEATYDAVIKGDNFKKLMANIKKIGKKKSNDQMFKISYVLTAETAKDVDLLIDFAHLNNINAIKLHHGYCTPALIHGKKSLPASSFFEDYSCFFDIESIKIKAAKKIFPFLTELRKVRIITGCAMLHGHNFIWELFTQCQQCIFAVVEAGLFFLLKNLIILLIFLNIGIMRECKTYVKQ